MSEQNFITCTVYGLASSEDGVLRYIGQTTQNLLSRLTDHLIDARNKRSNYRHKWIASVIKGGHKIVMTVLKENAVWNSDEITLIAQHKALGFRLVNTTAGGDGMLGVPMSKAHKEKLISIHQSRVVSEETRERMGESRDGEKNGFAKLLNIQVLEIVKLLEAGVIQIEIAKKFNVSQQTISKINRMGTRRQKMEASGSLVVGRGVVGVPKTAEHKAKIGAAHKGRKSPWTAERNRQSKGKPGHPSTPETNAKISAATKGKPKTGLAERNKQMVWTDEMRAKIGDANRKISLDDVSDIKKRLSKGERQSAIARMFGVSDSLVSQIKLGKKYVDVK